LIIHFDLTFDKFEKDGDRIYRVVSVFTFQGEPGWNSGVTGPLPEAVKNEVTGLQSSAPFFEAGGYNVIIPATRNPVKFKSEDAIFADGRYFDMFGYKWLAGSAKTSLNAPHQVVFSIALL